MNNGLNKSSRSFTLIYKFPNPVTVNKDLPWPFSFYEQYTREHSRARKLETTQCSTAHLTQPKTNVAAPFHGYTARAESCDSAHSVRGCAADTGLTVRHFTAWLRTHCSCIQARPCTCLARLVLHVQVYCFARGTDPCIAVPRRSVSTRHFIVEWRRAKEMTLDVIHEVCSALDT